jgi:glycosyltransferase involved in cell wall biosynthesis
MKRHSIKIAFDASPLLVNKTGVAYYIERLIERMAKQYSDEVELVGFYYNFLSKKSVAHFPKAPNIHYRSIRFIPSKVVYQLRRWGISPPLELLVKERVDFVLFGNFWGYPSLRRTPAAPVVHDLTYLDLPDYVAAKNRKDLTRLVPEQIKRSRFVITVSDFSKKKIAEVYSVRPSDILVTPIPPPKPVHHNRMERRKELAKLGINKPFILFLGTVEPRKNIVNLIDAYERLPEKLRSSYSLVIAGRVGWNCDSEVKRIQQARQSGLDVIHVGYISDRVKAVLYESATIFVSASHYEGFGMPVLEAMSYGVPCAISDIQVFREVGGNAAQYFDQADPLSICEAISEMLSHPKILQKMHSQSYKQASKIGWEAVARSVMREIQRAIQK